MRNVNGELRPDGSRHWIIDNKYHRLDGPALIYANGSRYWYQNGEQHRVDGPALIGEDDRQYWIQNGKWHRLDGPAVSYPDGRQHWFINNKNIDVEFNCWILTFDIGPWEQWTELEKLMFRIKFE